MTFGDTLNPNSTGDILEPPEDSDEAGMEIGIDAQADFEMETELQIQDAIESFQQIKELDPQTWQVRDAAERLEVLQNIENRMAEIQGRPALEIVAAEMEAGTFGGYNEQTQNIELNASRLNGDLPVSEFINTVIHEGRHAYQDYAIQHPGFIADTALVSGWSDNWEHYLTAEEYGQELYATQPIEADAWSYAGRITNSLIADSLRNRPVER